MEKLLWLWRNRIRLSEENIRAHEVPPEIFKLELNYVKLTAVNDSCCFKSHTVNISQLKFGVES